MYFLFPFLLCLFPIHTVFAENYAEISVKDYLFTMFVTTVFLLGAVFGLNLVVDKLIISEWCVVFNYFAFLLGNYVFIGLFSPYKRSLLRIKIGFIIAYLSLCFAVSFLMVKFLPIGLANGAAKITFWGALIITGFIAADIFNRLKTLDVRIDTASALPKSLIKNPPDIYHIITDSHSGFDRPEYCDEFFREELGKRGFCVYQKARSNYDITYCSLTSCLNMDYIHNLVEPKDGLYSYPTVWPYYTKNKVFSFFRQHGYKFYFSVCKELAHLLDGKEGTIFSGNLWNTLLFSSLAVILNGTKSVSVNECIFNHFKKFVRFSKIKTNTPKYAYMHFLAPHLPFLVDENGKKNKESEVMKIENYLPYLKFVDKELLKLIDKIKSNMNPNSIILIHGDHSYPGFNAYSHKILLTAYFPKEYNSECIKQNSSLVNLFPQLLNEVFGTDYNELEDEYFHVVHRVGEIHRAQQVAE